MKVRIPKLGQSVKFKNGRSAYLIGVTGVLNSDGTVDRLTFETRGCGCESFKSVISEIEWGVYNVRCPYSIGEELLFHRESYKTKKYTLEKGKVEKVRFTISESVNLYWLQINDSSNVDIYNIYRSLKDFSNRTKPKKSLKDGEKYIMTDYLCQQNRLLAVKSEEISENHSKYDASHQGYMELEIETSHLYQSHESFLKEVFSAI